MFMRKLLFVSSGLITSNTSAAIRNRRLVSELKKHFDVYAIDVAPHGTPVSYAIDGITAAVIQSSVYAASNIGVYGKKRIFGRVSDFFKRIIRCIVPDKYFIELLFNDFSQVFPDKVCFDVVMTSSDPKGIHACLLNRSFRQRFLSDKTVVVEYWGDPWYGDINFYTNKLTMLMEKHIFGLADHVIFNSMATYREKADQYRDVAMFHFLSRGVDGDVSNLPDELNRSFETISLMYAGDYFSVSRNIDPLVRAVGRLPHSLVVVGDGDKVGNPPPNVRFISRVDFNTAQRMTHDAGLLVVLLNRVGGQVPGKLYDYASTTHPILVLYEDESQLPSMPFPERFIFIKNEEQAIYAFLDQSRSFNVVLRSVKKASFADEVIRFLMSSGLSAPE